MGKYRKGGFRPTRHYYYWLQDGICAYCHIKVEHADFTVDHIIPVSKGGPVNDPRNCVGACIDCNSAKADDWPNESLWARMMTRNGWAPLMPMAWKAPDFFISMGLMKQGEQMIPQVV